MTYGKTSFIITHSGITLRKRFQYFINNYLGKDVYILIKNNSIS